MSWSAGWLLRRNGDTQMCHRRNAALDLAIDDERIDRFRSRERQHRENFDRSGLNIDRNPRRGSHLRRRLARLK